MDTILSYFEHKAKLTFDDATGKFRGEVLGLSGSADFYGSNAMELKAEMKNSIVEYLKVCSDRNIDPYAPETN